MILLPDSDEDFATEWNNSVARWDDATWSRVLRQPFRWQTFLNWWVARRWVMPRDIRRT